MSSQELLYHINDPVIVTDTNQQIVFFNAAAQQVFQLPPSHTVVGRPLRDIVRHPDLLALYDEDSMQRSEIAFPQQVFMAQLTTLDDVGTIIVMHDVTQQRRIDLVRGNFIATVSQDIRGPLTAILGYMELLERVGPLNEQQRDFVGRVIFGVHSIAAMLSNLMELEKLEADLDMERSPVHMAQIVEYVLESYQRRMEEKRHQCEVWIEADIATVQGNPIRLRQMVNHLIENAIKYTPENGHIRVELYAESTFVLLTITDNGIGIAPDEHGYIFAKFYRASNANDSTTGSGLGLSIVKMIVEQHNGRIWVESQLNKGSSFTVMLPT